jgi:hypothetical protein
MEVSSITMTEHGDGDAGHGHGHGHGHVGDEEHGHTISARARPACLSALSVLHSEPVLYGAFV